MVKWPSMMEEFSKGTTVYREFEALISGNDTAIDLAQAALLIACVAYPDLDIAYYKAQLDALACRVCVLLGLQGPAQLPHEVEPRTIITAMNKVLFEEEQFRGNQQDYYNPANSFLNKVLEEHTGIPITLSLLYMEVGKRVGIELDGIGLPFHFIVRCTLPAENIYIDVFEGGQLLNEQDCQERIRLIANSKIQLHARWFEPVSHRQLLLRMLGNLKNIYIDKEEYTNVLAICDHIVLLAPHAPLERRDRGHIHFQLKHYSQALHDLTDYLMLAPKAEDGYEVRQQVRAIRQIIAMMN